MNKKETEPNVGALKKRRVVMADGRRYLIYYTFEKDQPAKKSPAREVKNDE